MNIKKSEFKNVIFLLSASFLWGITFINQSICAKYMDSYMVLFLRSLIGAVSIFPLMIYSIKKNKNQDQRINSSFKDLLLGALVCGGSLTLASLFQQTGLKTVSASKGGFITALYIVLVPFFGIFLKKRLKINTLLGIIISLIGSFVLSFNFNENLSIGKGDVFVFIGSIFFALQIIGIEIFSKKINLIVLSFLQLITQGIISFIVGFSVKGSSWFINNTFNLESIISVIAIGILSSGIAFTLQILGQKNYDPSKASLLLSLESVFSAICSTILYSFYKFSDVNQYMSVPQIIGAILIFIGVIVSQLDFNKFKKENVKNE